MTMAVLLQVPEPDGIRPGVIKVEPTADAQRVSARRMAEQREDARTLLHPPL